MRKSERPHVICHMGPSIDGRIVIDGWGVGRALSAEYEATAKTFDADAWIIGRVSMEPYAGKAAIPPRRSRTAIPRRDFLAKGSASYAIGIDPSGKLRWKSGTIDGEQVVTVLTEDVPDRYLAFLQDTGVSYLFGGKSRIDLPTVLQKLRRDLGIRTLLLEGGGGINGTFLEAGLIDELSVLVAPVADGSVGTPTLFDARKGTSPRRLRLISVERRSTDFVWLRYRVR